MLDICCIEPLQSVESFYPLSRNLLFLICQYLTSVEIVTLMISSSLSEKVEREMRFSQKHEEASQNDSAFLGYENSEVR